MPPSLLCDLWGADPQRFRDVLGLDSGRQEQWFGQDIAAGDGDAVGEVAAADPDGEEVFWEQFWNSEACSYPDRTGDLRSVMKISDFYSARQWHSTGMYDDILRPVGIEHTSGWCAWRRPPGRLPGRGGSCGCFSFAGRGGTFPNATKRCWHCCAPTCTRPTSTPNGVATPRPR